MRFLTSLTLTVCVLSILYTAMMMLVPDRFRRELRSVLSLITVVTLGAVILGADFSDISARFENLSFETGNYSRDQLIQNELETRIADYISTILSERGISCKKITVGTTIDSERRISITKASLTVENTYLQEDALITSLIKENIGDIEVKITYEDS